MAKERRIFFRVGPGGRLTPAGPADLEAMERFTPGALVSTEAPRQPRNPRFSRLYWGCLALLLPHQDMYPTVDDLHEGVKIALGYFDMRESPITGHAYARTHSIAFDAMDEAEFHVFFDKFVQLAAERIVPNCGPMLRQQWDAMLDGPEAKLEHPKFSKRRKTDGQSADPRRT